MSVKKRKKKMSEGTKVALFGAVATIAAALITGIFTIIGRSPTSNLSQPIEVTSTPILSRRAK